jgi:hypothetical protein
LVEICPIPLDIDHRMQAIDANQEITKTSYDQVVNITLITDVDNNTTTDTYDAALIAAMILTTDRAIELLVTRSHQKIAASFYESSQL